MTHKHSKMQNFSRKTKALTFLLLAMSVSLLAQSAPAAGDSAEETDMNPLAGDTWLIAAWGKICDGAKAFWEWLSGVVNTMLFEDLGMSNANYTTLIIILAVLTIMLASGAWAASIAMMRRHTAPKYFIYGFLTFFIGPAHLMYSLDIKGEKEQKEMFAREAEEKRAEEAERKLKEAEQAKERGKEAPAVSSDGVVFDQAYFESIQRKEDGTPNGPWRVAYNGIEITVNEIVEVLPECVQVRMINLEGNPMVGRIPYSRIEKWETPE